MKSLILLAFLSWLLVCPDQVAGQNSSAKEFVTKHYFHGIPYVKAKAFGPEVVPELLSMLNNPEYEEFRSNIILTIGMIGDEASFPPLKEYFERQQGEITTAAFISTLVVFQALGYIAQSDNQAVIEYISSWTEPNSFKSKALSFTHEKYNNEVLFEVIGRIAIQALGISGTEKALVILENLRETEPEIKAKYSWEWSDNIEEAIVLNKKVKREGPDKAFSTQGY